MGTKPYMYGIKEIYVVIGKFLRYYRRLSNMTQAQVAEKAGINEKYYGELERDESSPTLNTLEKICIALNIEVKDFFQDTNE